MLKPLSVTTDHVKPMQAPPPELAQRVFRAMHGYYGNLFLSKFANGVVSDNGQDKGVADAMKVWAYELRRFDGDTVLAAIEGCKNEHKEFPPSLPQFIDLCRAKAPREPVRMALPMSDALVAERSKPARGKLRELRENLRPSVKRAEAEPGLSTLFSCIADAVACAGGDEAAELRRLEGLYA